MKVSISKKLIAAIVGILGIWFAVWISNVYIQIRLSALPYFDCSGMNPCKDEEYSVYFTGFTIGGIVGALIVSSIIQHLKKKSVQLWTAIFYGVLGAVSWPLVGVAVFFISIIPLEILRDIPVLKEYASLIVLGTAFGICGAAIGLVVFKVIKERSPVQEQVVYPDQNV